MPSYSSADRGSRIIISNSRFENCGEALKASSTRNVYLFNNEFLNNDQAISFSSVLDSSIMNVLIKNNNQGLNLKNCYNLRLLNNVIEDNDQGLIINDVKNSVFSYLTLNNNEKPVTFKFSKPDRLSNVFSNINIDEVGTITVLKNKHDETFSFEQQPNSLVMLIDSDNVSLKNLESSNSACVVVSNSSQVSVQNIQCQAGEAVTVFKSNDTLIENSVLGSAQSMQGLTLFSGETSSNYYYLSNPGFESSCCWDFINSNRSSVVKHYGSYSLELKATSNQASLARQDFNSIPVSELSNVSWWVYFNDTANINCSTTVTFVSSQVMHYIMYSYCPTSQGNVISLQTPPEKQWFETRINLARDWQELFNTTSDDIVSIVFSTSPIQSHGNSGKSQGFANTTNTSFVSQHVFFDDVNLGAQSEGNAKKEFVVKNSKLYALNVEGFNGTIINTTASFENVNLSNQDVAWFEYYERFIVLNNSQPLQNSVVVLKPVNQELPTITLPVDSQGFTNTALVKGLKFTGVEDETVSRIIVYNVSIMKQGIVLKQFSQSFTSSNTWILDISQQAQQPPPQTNETFNVNTGSRVLTLDKEFFLAGSFTNTTLQDNLLTLSPGKTKGFWVSPVLVFDKPVFWNSMMFELVQTMPGSVASIVPNHGFEELDDNNLPLHWSVNNWWNVTAINNVSTDAFTGSYSALINVLNVGTHRPGTASWRSEFIPETAGTFKVEYAVKALITNARNDYCYGLEIAAFDNNYNRIYTYYDLTSQDTLSDSNSSFTGGWVKRSFTVAMPENTSFIRVWIRSGCTGTYLFDDITVKKLWNLTYKFRSGNSLQNVSLASWGFTGNVHDCLKPARPVAGQGLKYYQLKIVFENNSRQGFEAVKAAILKFQPAFRFNVPQVISNNSVYSLLSRKSEAGSFGFTIVKDGHLYFAQSTNTLKRARFWGVQGFWIVNLCRLWPNCDDQASLYADRIAKLGYNMYKTGFGLVNYLLQSHDFEELNQRFYNIDKLFYELKRRGVYIYLQPIAYELPEVCTMFNSPYYDYMHEFLTMNCSFPEWMINRQNRSYLRAAIFSLEPNLMNDYKNGLRMVFNHVNPYTGLKYGEDPAMVVVELSNENYLIDVWEEQTLPPGIYPEPYERAFDSHWHEWLRAKYNNSFELLRQAWSDGTGTALLPEENDFSRVERLPATPYRSKGNTFSVARTLDLARFYQSQMIKYYQNISSFLRSLGVRQPIIAMQSIQRYPAVMQAASVLDIADSHAYMDHPSNGLNEFGIIKNFNAFNIAKQRLADWWKRHEATLVGYLAFSAVKDKPFSVSETNWANFNDYQFMQIPEMSGYSSYQDFDLIIQHAYAGTRHGYGKDWIEKNYLLTEGNPLILLSSLLGADLFLNFKTKPAQEWFVLKYSNQSVWDKMIHKALLEQDVNLYSAFYMPQQQPKSSNAYVSRRLALQKGVRVSFGNQEPTTSIPVPNNGFCTNCVSDTGELIYDYNRGLFILDNEKANIFSGKLSVCNSQSCDAQALRILNSKNDWGLAWLQSITDDDLNNSSMLVLLTLGKVSNTGTVRTSDNSRSLYWGDSPVVLEAVNLTLRLSLNPNCVYNVYVLNKEGFPTSLVKQFTGTGVLNVGEAFETPWYVIKRLSCGNVTGNASQAPPVNGTLPTIMNVSVLTSGCFNDIDCDDHDTSTIDKCVLQGQTGFCLHAKIVTSECSTDKDCDDSNPCTVDKCVSKSFGKVCENKFLTSCCGNGVCEAFEENTCVIDCEPSKAKIFINAQPLRTSISKQFIESGEDFKVVVFVEGLNPSLKGQLLTLKVNDKSESFTYKGGSVKKLFILKAPDMYNLQSVSKDSNIVFYPVTALLTIGKPVQGLNVPKQEFISFKVKKVPVVLKPLSLDVETIVKNNKTQVLVKVKNLAPEAKISIESSRQVIVKDKLQTGDYLLVFNNPPDGAYTVKATAFKKGLPVDVDEEQFKVSKNANLAIKKAEHLKPSTPLQIFVSLTLLAIVIILFLEAIKIKKEI